MALWGSRFTEIEGFGSSGKDDRSGFSGTIGNMRRLSVGAILSWGKANDRSECSRWIGIGY